MKKLITLQIQQRLLVIIGYSAFVFLLILPFKVLASPLPDVIRTGGPSKPHEAKIAVLVSQNVYAGKPFTVTNEKGDTVFSGTLKEANNPIPWNYAATADFSSLTTPGRYTLQSQKLRSEPWVIDENAGNDLIPILLGLFHANRDGYEPSFQHKPAHLHDATVKGGRYDNKKFDLTGGWMDAGDQRHFTDTAAYAAIMLQIAAKLDLTHADELNNEADVGIRWLLKTHPLPDLFIGQIGDWRDSERGFRDPAEDDQSALPGIGYRFAYPSGLSGMMGKVAAALALAAERNTGKERANLLAQAQQWYQQGKENHSDEQLPGHYYDNLTWHDDMSLAAVMLWRVTGNDQYQRDAYTYLDDDNDYHYTFSNPSIGLLSAADLCGTTGHEATTDIKVRELACGILRTAAQEVISTATMENAPWGTPGRMTWGQLGDNGGHGAIIALAKRVNLISDAAVAVRARDWLLGLNPWGNSFIVGYGVNPPTTPYHWASVFGESLPKGAVVGGPASITELTKVKVTVPKKGQFDSDRAIYCKKADYYVTSEPSLVYNANSILLIASLKSLK
ncbi:Secreted hydrolase [Crenothrix polyspora]|uniref:Secreted hydrolase n=1 Tax=Crenothrix polyspora TaxID=360316 RepID=A0A1R4H2N6_9GAMM|nr:Secreted hydrolase [Crenothrix polyspora]